MGRWRWIALLGALCCAVPALGEGWGYELADELMSPYCPGRALSECPSPNAAQLRGWILEQEKVGRSRDEVEAQLFARFGDQLRQAPRVEGVGLVAYLVPLMLFAGGGLLVVVFLRRSGSSAPAPPTSPVAAGPADEELERLLDEAVRDED